MLDEELKELADILGMLVRAEDPAPSREEVLRVAGKADSLLAALIEEGQGILPEGGDSGEMERAHRVQRQAMRLRESLGKAVDRGLIGASDGEVRRFEKLWASLQGAEGTGNSSRLARELRDARAKAGLRQFELAEKLGISKAYLSRLENAACNLPSSAIMARLQRFLEGLPPEPAAAAPAAPAASSAPGERAGPPRKGRRASEAAGGEGGRDALMRELLESALKLDDDALGMLVRLASMFGERIP